MKKIVIWSIILTVITLAVFNLLVAGGKANGHSLQENGGIVACLMLIMYLGILMVTFLYYEKAAFDHPSQLAMGVSIGAIFSAMIGYVFGPLGIVVMTLLFLPFMVSMTKDQAVNEVANSKPVIFYAIPLNTHHKPILVVAAFQYGIMSIAMFLPYYGIALAVY
jgi:hypothetical protein